MDSVYTVMIIVLVLVAVICLIAILVLTLQAQNEMIEESDCNQLLQLIKDRGNDTPPRHDKILSKWVALECWK